MINLKLPLVLQVFNLPKHALIVNISSDFYPALLNFTNYTKKGCPSDTILCCISVIAEITPYLEGNKTKLAMMEMDVNDAKKH